MRTLLLLVLIWASGGAALGDPRENAAFYVDTYGVADPAETPGVARAEAIFERLERVSGQATLGARLLVIDSTGKPWAIALADGNVVLSKGALDIVYGDGDTERGDAWLAFVLGHELAHLGTRDLWHQHVYASLSGAGAGELSPALQKALSASALDLDAWRERELRADEVGYLLAALAGYPVERIFSGAVEARDFLDVWVEQTRSGGAATHHGAAERTAFLRARLRSVADRVTDFMYGVRLAHFGRHGDALHFLREFRRHFPSRQALGNLGYVHIQLAREAMPERLAYRFWMPTLLETDSGLRAPTRGLAPDELPEASREHLAEATLLLEAAVAMDRDDIVSRLNLVVAYLHLGRGFRARTVVEEALALRPRNVQLQALRALVVLEQEPLLDTWPRVVETLEPLAAGENAPANVLFNLARLLDERGRHGRADGFWSRLAVRIDELPTPYATIVCERLADPESCSGSRGEPAPPAAIAALFPIGPGTDLAEPGTRRALEGWRGDRRRVGPLDASVYSTPEGSVLALDDVVELATLVPPASFDPASLARELGEPRVILPANGARIEAYGRGVSVLRRDGRVEEIWLAR